MIMQNNRLQILTYIRNLYVYLYECVYVCMNVIWYQLNRANIQGTWIEPYILKRYRRGC